MAGPETTWEEKGKPRQSPTLRPFLTVLFDAERPLGPTSRHALEGLARVEIGRGADRHCERRRQPGGATLALRLADRWMSSEHARITREVGQWVLEVFAAEPEGGIADQSDGFHQTRALSVAVPGGDGAPPLIAIHEEDLLPGDWSESKRIRSQQASLPPQFWALHHEFGHQVYWHYLAPLSPGGDSEVARALATLAPDGAAGLANSQALLDAAFAARSPDFIGKYMYPTENAREWFAEATAAYLSHLDIAPYGAAAIREHDPELFALLEAIYGPSPQLTAP
jgi:hypothetical protein